MARSQYHALTVALHWLMFLMMVFALACIEIRAIIPRESGDLWRNLLLGWHINTGVLILLLVLVRIGARVGFGAPERTGSAMSTRLAHALHGVLYLVMILQPLSGILSSQSAGYTVGLGGGTLPTLVSANDTLHTILMALHSIQGNTLYFLIGMHVLAALWHHYVLKDSALKRMRWR